jgi:hypothetical protein
MTFEQYKVEKEKPSPRERLAEILRREPKELKEIEKLEIQSKIFVEKDKLNWHDDFLGLIESELKDSKILDLFCGSNSIKEYSRKKNLKAEVIGVDISSERADIKANAAEIEKFIPPEKQFNIIFDLGGVPKVVKTEVIEKYLKDEGLFITSSSSEMFREQIDEVLKNPQSSCQGTYSEETKEFLKYFQPIVSVEVKGKKNFLSKKLMDDVYIIWKKREME